MVIPRWLVFTLSAWVLVFGGYRLWVALRRDSDDTTKDHWRQKSVFGRTKRAHLIYGIVYVLAGSMLLATGFGVEMPFARGCRAMFDNQASQEPAGGDKTLQLETAPAETESTKAAGESAPAGE
jgi:hypothetical protein